MGIIHIFSHNKLWLVGGAVRAFGSSSRVYSSHYDVLGITPKATQRDIKSAYYKLSKIYHPDKSKDEESARKFRAITEAYEVLGNLNLKKMYDKGLMSVSNSSSQMRYKPEEEPVDPSLKFYRSRAVRHVIPNYDGRTPIYDFDTWSREHYGNLLKKNQHAKRVIKTKRESANMHYHSVRQEFLIYFVSSVVFIFIVLTMYGTSDFDREVVEKKKPRHPSSPS